jgi:hypothetical protein
MIVAVKVPVVREASGRLAGHHGFGTRSRGRINGCAGVGRGRHGLPLLPPPTSCAAAEPTTGRATPARTVRSLFVKLAQAVSAVLLAALGRL